MPSIFFIEPIFFRPAICVRKSLRSKSSPASTFFLSFSVSFSSKFFSACSMRVRMSPMSRIRSAIRSGWNCSKSFIDSPVEANMIGLPVTTAGVAVELREHDTGEVDAVEERLGGLHRVLTDHGVDDEEDLVRVDRAADVRGLLHELFVDAESTGGVDDDDVMQLRLRDLDR